MGANLLDLYIEKGSDYSKELSLAQDGLPIDLTLYTVRSKLIDSNDDKTNFVITENSNKIILSLDNSVTEGLASGKGSFDLEIVEDATSKVVRLLKGRVFIDKEVTV